MAKNKLSDLNDHLFLAIERLNSDDLTDDRVDAECKKANAIMGLSGQFVKGAKITLDAHKLIASGQFEKNELEAFGLKSKSGDEKKISDGKQ